LNQPKNVDDKQQILGEISALRSEVGRNLKIRLRAQTDISEMLDGAVKALNEDPVDISLHRAASQISLARKRASQAESQGELLPWLPLLISFFLATVLGLVAWAIVSFRSTVFEASPAWSSVLLGAVLFGAAASAVDGFRELHTRIARQELDINRLAWYLSHPIIGAALGGILFFVIYAGLLALTQAGDNSGYNPTLVYALAALAGFGQRQVIMYFRETLADILRIKRETPDEAG
jgi:hypothetical protein